MGHVIELGEPEDNKPKADAKLQAEELREVFEGLAHELSRRGQRTKPPRN
jgi:hypothetical protein